jgi:hypothetical protein
MRNYRTPDMLRARAFDRAVHARSTDALLVTVGVGARERLNPCAVCAQSIITSTFSHALSSNPIARKGLNILASHWELIAGLDAC